MDKYGTIGRNAKNDTEIFKGNVISQKPCTVPCGVLTALQIEYVKLEEKNKQLVEANFELRKRVAEMDDIITYGKCMDSCGEIYRLKQRCDKPKECELIQRDYNGSLSHIAYTYECGNCNKSICKTSKFCKECGCKIINLQ